MSVRFEKEMAGLVETYNRQSPSSTVELVHGGEDFSSLKELIASGLAGMPPDLAVIECSELPALESLKFIQAIPPARFRELTEGMPSWLIQDKSTLPWLRTLPVLLVDQEMVYRVKGNPDRLPSDWKGLKALAQKLAQANEQDGEYRAMTFPFYGARGLWLFEAFAQAGLWTREAGGLKANRKLKPAFEFLRNLTLAPKLAQSDLPWERALQAFLDRKTSILVASYDALPYIASKTSFRWSAIPLPSIQGAPSTLSSGSDWVVLKSSPEAWKFLSYLYSSPVAQRWVSAGGFYPLKKAWVSASWQELPASSSARNLSPKELRSTDRDVVRARSVWIRNLRGFFHAPSDPHAPSLDASFAHLDGELNSSSAHASP